MPRRPSITRPALFAGALWIAAVLIPTASILWLMNEAAKGQTTAARQSVLEAYRTQIRFISQQINTFWQHRAEELDGLATWGSAADFKKIVTSGNADSVVFLDANGLGTYPEDLSRRGDHGTPAAIDAAVLTRRDVIRNLLVSGDRAGALAAIERDFLSPGARHGYDSEGRLVNADEHLLALTLMKPGDPRRPALIERFVTLLNDYDTVTMPSSQRLFLMTELRAIAPDVKLPTHEAEGMAADFLDAESPRADLMGVRPTRVADIWQLASPSGRVVALYRQDTVHMTQHHYVDAYQTDMVRFAIFPPGEDAYDEAVAVGASLPGWQAAFTLLNVAALDQSAHARAASYAWVGVVGIGLFAVIALGAGHTFRRQLRLTRLKTDLVAAVSHELRTPLASMRLLVDALLQDQQLDPQKTREYLGLIAVENTRLSRLIDNFLTFSRLERNRHRFEMQPTAPSEIVDSAVAAMRERLHPGCAIDVSIAPDLPAVRADADALVTALLNLLDNAYKYTADDKRIAVRARAEGRNVIFAVEDNGIGIPTGEQRRIFRRFYRVDRRLARDTAGVGLGLSIVHEIVRAHGGTVHVRSDTGKGSTFIVRVPAAAGAAA